ncbi:hypothetical protein LTR09_002068 [Extremus antarcticus]|uniref:Uncharacterized protein n=1 Tax=Extremus antarcticus TaxID=702011 RepID=A0AAJ0LVT6_9PEZI|nr:hypothetical protein LTR09_002068 [Extremus antarcticus]
MAEDQDLEQLEARLAALGTNVQEAIDEPGEDAERFRSIKKRVADVRTDIEELKASRLEPAGGSNNGDATNASTVHEQQSAAEQSSTLHSTSYKAQQDVVAFEAMEESVRWVTLGHSESRSVSELKASKEDAKPSDGT